MEVLNNCFEHLLPAVDCGEHQSRQRRQCLVTARHSHVDSLSRYLLWICRAAGSGSCPHGVCNPLRGRMFDIDHTVLKLLLLCNTCISLLGFTLLGAGVICCALLNSHYGHIVGTWWIFVKWVSGWLHEGKKHRLWHLVLWARSRLGNLLAMWLRIRTWGFIK